MNRLDRLISWAAPQWAMRRDRARTMSAFFKAQYDMAKRRRANDGWLTPSTSANAEVANALVISRDRARDLVRNNPYARRIVDVWTAHLVGDGITVAWIGADGQPEQVRQDAFKRWADDGECDADGQLDFYGQQQLAVRTMVEAGEVLIRKRVRRLSDGLTIPLQLQVLESDHLDHSKNEVRQNGTMIIQGVEFSPIGRRTGYWLFRNHPGDNTFAFQSTSVFVPADQIIHLYRKLRPGQVRGMTWLAAAGNRLKDIADLDDAVIMKAKIEACLTGWIQSPDDDVQLGEQTEHTDDDGNDLLQQTMEPGTIGRLRPGEKIEFSEPSSGGAYEGYKRQFEQSIATAAGITYDQLTGDLARANFASLRAGKIEFRRDLSQVQWQTLIPQLCENVGRTFNEIGIAAGMWSAAPVQDLWMPPRNEPIDPKKDTEAELSDVAAGFESWSSTVSRRGHNPRTLAAQHQADDAMLNEFGLQRFIPSATGQAAAPVAQPEDGNDAPIDDQ